MKKSFISLMICFLITPIKIFSQEQKIEEQKKPHKIHYSILAGYEGVTTPFKSLLNLVEVFPIYTVSTEKEYGFYTGIEISFLDKVALVNTVRFSQMITDKRSYDIFHETKKGFHFVYDVALRLGSPYSFLETGLGVSVTDRSLINPSIAQHSSTAVEGVAFINVGLGIPIYKDIATIQFIGGAKVYYGKDRDLFDFAHNHEEYYYKGITIPFVWGFQVGLHYKLPV